MRKSDQIRDEVEKTMQSFDHDAPLEPNPFLFTRIQAELTAYTSGVAKTAFWHVRLRHVVIMGIVLINLITVIHFADWNSEVRKDKALISELETEFSIGGSAGDF